MAKICKRLNVPHPGQGFWAKKQAGYHVDIPKLPPLKNGQQTEVYIRPKEKLPPQPREPENPELEALINFEKLLANKITVPAYLSSPYPLILQTKEILKKREPDKYGRAWSYAMILDEKIYFCIEESSRRIEREPTKKEKQDRERWPSLYTSILYEYIPSGILTLKINNGDGGSFQKVWTDGKKRRLEDCLNEFIIGLYRMAFREKEFRREQEERHRRWQEEQRHREEQERLYQEEQERIKALENEVNNWHKSRQIRYFIHAYRESIINKHAQIEPGSELDRWLTWAGRYADELDPIR